MVWSRYHSPVNMAVSVRVLWALLALALVGLPACSWTSGSDPSVLVIAVENLAFERLSCESGDLAGREFESFRIFCEEGVRFTHAFTTSTLSQPGMASILTGLYPLEHGVRANGRDALSSRILTVPEVAAQSGYRTWLISGGAPILRKSGLGQGFEVFDDVLPFSEQNWYRPAQDVVKNFISRLDKESGRKRFFSVLYLSDLQFPEVETRSDLGEIRDRSFDSQVKEVAESLTQLIAQLKARRIWHRTHVFLVGLNGSSGRTDEWPPLNLYSENTRVALFLKPARPNFDQGPQWTVDKNVSLSDLGHSLFEFVGGHAPEPPLSQLPRISLYGLVNQPSSDWSDDRLILTESGWGSWRALSGVRYAARRRQYFYIHDASPKIYNTLLDRLENNPLPKSDPLWQTLQSPVLDFFSINDLPVWSIRDREAASFLNIAQAWWKEGNSEVNAAFPSGDLDNAQLRRWRARRALDTKEWQQLQLLGEREKEPLYSYVAKRNLGVSARHPGGICAKYFAPKSKKADSPVPRAELMCGDDLFAHLISWLNGDGDGRSEWARDTFFREYRYSFIDSLIGAANYRRYAYWDVSLHLPVGATLTDLFLALPENRNLAEQLRVRRLRIDSAVDL